MGRLCSVFSPLVSTFESSKQTAMSDLTANSSVSSSLASSASSTSSITIVSNQSSRRSSLASSKPEFRPAVTEMIRRNLVKEFLTSTSYQEKKRLRKYVQNKKATDSEKIILSLGQEDEIDKDIFDILDDKLGRKDNSNTLMFNMDPI